MQPGERVDIIRRVAIRLAASDDWTVLDLVLEQFGFETWGRWQGDKESYAIRCLKGGDDSSLSAIDEYLMGHSRAGNDPWEGDGFRLFLTHVAEHKKEAHELKYSLRFFGVDAFVAHDDIQAGEEWQAAIRSALHSSDALAGLLHQGFRESDWCDQEVGIALGRGIPAVPIQCTLPPYGFFGSVQAVNHLPIKSPRAVARDLVVVLLRDKRVSEKLTQTIVDRLASATSYGQANTLSGVLAEHAPLLSEEQIDQLRKAEKENSELQGAYDFNHHISEIEAKIHATDGPSGPIDYDDEPF